MEAVHVFDTAFRGAAIGFALGLAAAAILGPARGSALSAIALFGAGLAAYLTVSAPLFDDANRPLFRLLATPSIAMPVILWWAGLEFFDAAIAVRGALLPVAALFAATGVAGFGVPPLATLRGLATVALSVHLLYIAWKSGPTDLLEPRRRARRVFLILGAGLCLVITAGEPGLLTSVLAGPETHLIQSGTLALLLGSFLVWFAANRDGLSSTSASSHKTLPVT